MRNQTKRIWHKWTESDTKYLVKHYSSLGGPALARKLGHTLLSVYRQASRYRLERRERLKWPKKEVAYVLRWYGKVPTEQIAAKLKRTKATIAQRAWILGISKKLRRWKESEIHFVIDKYPTTTSREIAEKLSQKKRSVEALVQKLRLRKSKRPSVEQRSF